MKKIIAVILASLMLLAVFAGCGSKTKAPASDGETAYSDIDLVKDGKTEYSILIPAEPEELEKTAAEELQTFFAQATGINLTVRSDSESASLGDRVIALGNTSLKEKAGVDTSSLDRHGYIVKTSDHAVIIAGKDGRGTVYGVYEFLERQFNYHYYTGDEIVIDRTTDCKLIDVNVSDAPFIPDYWIGYETSSSYYNAQLRYRASHEFEISRWPHSHLSFLPVDKYGEHTDWYDPSKKALCLTNPEVMEEMAKVVIEFAEANPDVEYVMLGAEDSWTKCTCDSCVDSDMQYTATGTDMIFNNYVADKLKEHFEPLGRTVNIVSLNYFNTEKPPVVYNDATGKYEAIDEKVIPHDNVYVHVCYVSADHSASLTDSKRNAAQIVNLDGWKALTDNLTAYTYNGLFINEGLVFFDDFAYKSDYIKTFGEYGYKFVFMEGSPTRVATFEPMRAYVTAELFWDPDQDVNALTSDFIENYYKAAAPYVQEYYDKISLHMSEMKAMYEAENKNFGAYVQFEMNDYLRTARTWPQLVLQQYLELFDKAFEAVEQAGYSTEVYEKMIYRLRVEELSPRYLLLLLYETSFTESEYARLVEEFNEDSASLGSIIRL